MIIDITFNLSLISADHWIVVIAGLMVVFTALTLLWLFFSFLTKIQTYFKNRITEKKEIRKINSLSYQTPDEINAAIAMALHLYLNELHDEEKHVLTINKVSKAYSPWSSKIYTVLNLRGRV